jgi:ABC-2 type transport system permease protein
MPLFFASNAIYPVSLMPKALQYIALGNPMTYVVDAMRAMLLTGNYSGLPLDIFALLISTSIMITIASLTLKRLIE